MPISFLLLHHPSSTPSQEGHKSQCLGIAISLTGNQLFPLLEGIPFGFWSTSRPLEELMSSLFPSLTSPVSRKMDPLDSSVCTLLSLTPHQVTPLPRALINAGHCHWPGLEEGTRPCIQGQCSSSLDLQPKEHHKCSTLLFGFITLKLLCLKNIFQMATQRHLCSSL